MRSHSVEDFGRVGYGTNGIDNIETFKTAIQQGYRLIDTADLYRNADSISEAINESGIAREEFYINYKILPNVPVEQFMHHVDEAVAKFRYVDCLMLHDMVTDDPGSYLKALREYIKADKIKCLGLSNVEYSRLKILFEEYPEISIIQNKFNHCEQDELVRGFCKEKDISYMGYGLFGGRDTLGACGYHFFVNNPAWNCSVITYPEFNKLIKDNHKSPHDMLLYWALQQGTIQIPGSTNSNKMTANLNAVANADSMHSGDQEKLAKTLISVCSEEEWAQIKHAASQGDRLAQFKELVGNSLPRHRLLEFLYRDECIKIELDFLYDRIQISDFIANDNISGNQNNDLHFSRQQATFSLCHFLEEQLKNDDHRFQHVIDMIRYFVKNCQTEPDRKMIFNLIDQLNDQTRPSYRYDKLLSYKNEIDYFLQHGYFTIKQLVLPYNRKLYSVSLTVLGPDHTIYILKNIPKCSSLKAISELLADQFPADFKDKNVLNSFYLPAAMDGINNISQATDQLSLLRLNIDNNDICGLGDNEDSHHLMSFYHNVTQNPEIFTNNQPVIEVKLEPNSDAYSKLLKRMEMTEIHLNILNAEHHLNDSREKLAECEKLLDQLNQNEVVDHNELEQREEDVLTCIDECAYYGTILSDLQQQLEISEERFKLSSNAYMERLKQQERERSGKLEEQTNKNDKRLG